ncbi:MULTISPECIES: alpha-amylase family glycosyl hydrolase [unclassified Leeuwenhoekiella]|uniref:alpha-amylase family glycosyl hydrolase n=1 Tax=unclassified Leeuwenhoekiella TaxID=2615029 RepID=UPI000C6277F1|nr:MULTISPECIES: alpha-amylase family glycosyl hydrolase [unclassified Leeuwenhoekiella]MAW94532.1 alpha-amlyase [Leeuwenhoekiella sp.]MBA81955.1 alpha-amlyase [Leeuwenhoekiella sp.]|tara:strand:+ start:1875 stop:4661 length:2787 start_codon:yes stop_codon:yes gene_type:complete
MKTRLLLFLIGFLPLGLLAQTVTLSPDPFAENEQITLTASNIPWTGGVYLWAWHYDSTGKQINNPEATGTNFNNSPETARFTDNGDGTFSYTLTPTEFYNNTGISEIGYLVKNQDGSQQGSDNRKSVGAFTVNLTAPTNTTTSIEGGASFNISATAGVTANFNLLADGTSINTQNATTSYSFATTPNINTEYRLEVTQTGTSNLVVRSFRTLVKPTPTAAAVPAGLEDGFNFDPSKPNEATLVFYAPGKEFIHVKGNFNGNDWSLDNSYLMNYDAATERHWIKLNFDSTTPQDLLYQYVVEYEISVADPYSTLILDEFNDQYIEASVFPDIPAYPVGKTANPVSYVERDETVYNWQITNFTPAKREDLVIYEVLLRDFDDAHSFQSLIDRLDYLENLGINAIELMPVQEFDGNNSWGYNPAFHMALDKYYGTRNALKTLVDAAHEKGMAVIIDVVYNHATGQNPYFRMYNTSNGGTGGQPSADSPFFNQTATHSYSVFNDFNHSKEATRSYVERTAQYWIEEFKIDGYRWDLTKGFTQNCSPSDESCTNAYQQDRVDVLKTYADMQWEKDDDFIIIFEHLGGITEEKQWADYRLSEGKGIMLWNKQTDPYNQSTMGYSENSNINGASYKQKGFSNPAAVTYMESHDEERLMYKNLAFGNSSGSYDVTELDTALKRMEAAGAVFFTVPGPKMIWQFGELGYDVSIFTCEDGSVPDNDSCKLSPKPDGWDYLDNAQRVALHDNWQRMILLKKKLAVFETSNFTLQGNSSNLTKKLHLSTTEAGTDEPNYLVVLANLNVTAQNITPDFQETGTWYDLMTNAEYEVTNTAAAINLQPGEYRIYGNKTANLSITDIQNEKNFLIYPNPTYSSFQISQEIERVRVYSIQGSLLKDESFDSGVSPIIDVSDLQSGLYLVEVERNGLQMTSKLIVK